MRITRTTRSRFATGAALLSLAAVAACGGSDTETATPEAPAASGSSAPAGEESEAPELEGTYTIGVFGPAQIPQGADIRDGAQLAADELNAAGGAGGMEVKIIFCDSENGAAPEKAVACATKFVQEDRVDAIAGGFSSGETLAMLDTVVRAQVPFVSTGAASPDVVKDVDSTGERKYIFRIGPINSTFLAADMCGTLVGKLAPATGFTKFGILFEDVEFARPLVAFLEKCLPAPSAATGGAIPIETGVEVVGVEKHLPDATDFSSQFSALSAAGAQYVIEVNSRQEGVALASQWGQLKPSFALGGINVAGQATEFFEATGNNAAFQMNGPAGIVRAPISEKTIPMFDAFVEAYDREPIYNGVSTYDGIYALAEAVEAAGSVAPDDVVAALEKMDRVGAQGVERFTANHDITYGAGDPSAGIVPVYYQFGTDGVRNIVFPEALAEGNTYMKPPWLP